MYYSSKIKNDKVNLLYGEPKMLEGLAVIELDNPPVNALSLGVLEELYEIFQYLNDDKNLKLIQINHKNSHFSAGADLKERSTMNDEDTLLYLEKINKCFTLLENIKVPTICWIKGGAVLGGGAELALCCDFIIAVDLDGLEFKIGFPETSIGIIPGAGGTYRLLKKMNLSDAKYWIFSGKIFSIKEAFSAGFIDLIFDDMYKAASFVESFLSKSRTALIAAKASINKCYLETDRKKQSLIELEEYKKTLGSIEREEALKKYKEK